MGKQELHEQNPNIAGGGGEQNRGRRSNILGFSLGGRGFSPGVEYGDELGFSP
jgi:hypothetical protein